MNELYKRIIGGKRAKKLVSDGGERFGSGLPPITPLVRLNSEVPSEAAHPLFDGSALGCPTGESASLRGNESVFSN